MIYVFKSVFDESVSVVFDETTLCDEDKKRGFAFEGLPDLVEQPGKFAVLKLDEAHNVLYYDYVDKSVDPLEERIVTVEDAIAELIMGGVM